MSDWAWHKFENTDGLTPADSEKSFDLGHGHPEVYAVEYKASKGDDARNVAATEYFRVNPHRLNMGVIGLSLPVQLSALTDIRQELKLYDGVIESSFKADGQPVDVITAAMQEKDAVIYRIKSPLLNDGRASVSIRFPYPTGKHADDAADWTKPERHTSRIISSNAGNALIEHVIDSTKYYLALSWQGEAKLEEQSPHHFTLSTDVDLLEFEAEYSQQPKTNVQQLVFSQELKAVIKAWNRWWNEGGIVDFSQCTDTRAKELERRVVLSQYLTQVNCANALPPQETGLTYNSWFGRPHLEMTWWHMVDFALWGRPQTVATVMDWYNDVAYPVARQIAQRQGFKGVRWMKMTDPWAGEAPSNTGSFLIWQQPHYLYMAEELYRANPSDASLKKYAEQVEETGYGIVMPTIDQLTLDEPQIIKQSGKYGIKLRASAPSIHMMRIETQTEVTPIVGSEQQSEELVLYMLNDFEDSPEKIWESNIFGKSLHELVNEGLHNKLNRMPDDARSKMKETIERIINEGCNGLICIIL